MLVAQQGTNRDMRVEVADDACHESSEGKLRAFGVPCPDRFFHR